MKRIIVYGSQYGTTEKYARELERQTGINSLPFQKVKSLKGYNQVIYLGGLYAGTVKGLKQSMKSLSDDAKLIVVTVGLASNKEENLKHILTGVEKQLSPEIYKKTQFFHLRGGIDYKKLSFKHKMMMAAMCQALKAKPVEKRSDDDAVIIESYNKQVDFTDFTKLDPIVKAIQNG